MRRQSEINGGVCKPGHTETAMFLTMHVGFEVQSSGSWFGFPDRGHGQLQRLSRCRCLGWSCQRVAKTIDFELEDDNLQQRPATAPFRCGCWLLRAAAYLKGISCPVIVAAMPARPNL